MTPSIANQKEKEEGARVIPMGSPKDNPTAPANQTATAPVGVAVYAAIARVQKALAQTGISKDRRNTQGSGFMFRGIDDVYKALAPLLAEHGLCILPRMLTRTVSERAAKSGGALFVVVVEGEFDFVSALDGSKHTVRMFGEAMDSGDKATNKAMSAAYKYAAFQAFCIPVEGAPDADEQTHDVRAAVPAGFEDWVLDLEAVASEGLDALKAAWTKSRPDLRKHLTETNNASWEALKARASKAAAHA